MRHSHGLRAALAGSGSLWTPELMETALWLDAADATTITTVSGAVSEWRDKSGYSRDLSQQNSSKRPSYQSSGFNGKPAIDFDGIDDCLKNNSYSGGTAYTVFAVMSRHGSASATLFLAGGSPYREVVFIPGGGYAEVSLYVGSTPAVGSNPNPSTVSSNFLVNTSWDGSGTSASDVRVRLNGTEQATTSSGAFGYVSESGFGIGIRPNQGSNPLDGVIAELIFFDSDLPTDTRQLIEGYLAHKWNLASNLPATHPYKTEAPRASSQNFEDVALLLHGDGTNGAQNNTFIDSSTNNFTITRSGNTTQGSFSPFPPMTGQAYSAEVNGGSAYFDGSGDYLSFANSSAFDIGLGGQPFTWEVWFSLKTLDSTSLGFARGGGLGGWNSTNGHQYTAFYYQPSQTLYFQFWNGGGLTTITGTTSCRIGEWNHFAVCYDGTTTRLFKNGVLEGTSTAAYGKPSQSTITRIGQSAASDPTSSSLQAGARLIKGTAIYTSNFTLPTAPPTAVTNTSLLLNFTNGGIIDQAARNLLETVGNAQISTTQKKFGTGALYLDASGNYLAQPNVSDSLIRWFDNNYTLEAWVYMTAAPTNGSNGHSTMIGNAQTNGSGEYWSFGPLNNRTVRFYYWSGAANALTTASALNTGQWYHLAFVKNGTSIKIYIDGTESASQTLSVSPQAGTEFPLTIGKVTANGGYNGFIDDLRITKGVARYTANFTPPSASFADF